MAHTHTSSHFACVRTMCDSTRPVASRILHLLARKRVSHPMAVACGRAGDGRAMGVAERAGGVGGASSCSPAISRPIPAQRGRRRPHRPPCRVRCFPGSSATRRAAPAPASSRLSVALSRASRIHPGRARPCAPVSAAAAGERRSGARVAGATSGCPLSDGRSRDVCRRGADGRGASRPSSAAPPPRPPATAAEPVDDTAPASRNARSTPPRAPAASSTRRARRPQAHARLAALADLRRAADAVVRLRARPTARRRHDERARARADSTSPLPRSRRMPPRAADERAGAPPRS